MNPPACEHSLSDSQRPIILNLKDGRLQVSGTSRRIGWLDRNRVALVRP